MFSIECVLQKIAIMRHARCAIFISYAAISGNTFLRVLVQLGSIEIHCISGVARHTRRHTLSHQRSLQNVFSTECVLCRMRSLQNVFYIQQDTHPDQSRCRPRRSSTFCRRLMYICIHVYVYIYVLYTYVCIYMYVHICRSSTSVDVRTIETRHAGRPSAPGIRAVYTYMSMCVCVCVCVCVCM